ncbi:MAG TPA: hypothetical protein VLX85_09645, partial [Stellaceae bacterium]|nr:hypothetical protein [Stellaceae bacterium]
MDLLIPSWGELAGWGGVLVATLIFIGGGRLLTAGRAAPELALIAGWGFACFTLTFWGVLAPWSMTWPALPLAAMGLLGFLPLRAPGALGWRGLFRIVAVSLPLLAVMASARPSLPDTFLNLLPNAAYLFDHARFPADGPSHSLLPGAPYNMQLAAFVAGLLTPAFPANAMIAFNIVLQLATALLLARLVEGDDTRAPSWGATAAGLLLATLINPGFVTRYDLSAYSEPSVTVATACAGWLAARATAALAERRAAATDLVLLALTLAALVNIKQDSVALAAAVVASGAALALLQGVGRRRALALLLLAAVPAALLYLAWRWYVLTHLPAGELKLLPVAQWQFDLIPDILRSMVGVLLEKAYFSLAVVAALVALAWRWRRRGLDLPTRVAALFAGVAILYNAALFFTYIAHFDNQIGASAHSYFRYNSHLGLLLMLALTLLARASLVERGWTLRQGWRRGAAGLTLGLALASPIAFFGLVRFDLEPAQQRAWVLADYARLALDRDPRLIVVLPGDDGSLQTMLDALIRFT